MILIYIIIASLWDRIKVNRIFHLCIWNVKVIGDQSNMLSSASRAWAWLEASL